MLKVVNERLSKSFINFRSKFVSKGNSSQIEHSILNAFKLIKKKIKTNPFFFFFEAVERVRFSILLQVFERKKKKTIKKIVIPKLIKKWIRYKRALYLLSKSIKLRKDYFLHDKISNELIEITLYKKSSMYLKKREIYNFAHFYHYNSFNIS